MTPDRADAYNAEQSDDLGTLAWCCLKAVENRPRARAQSWQITDCGVVEVFADCYSIHPSGVPVYGWHGVVFTVPEWHDVWTLLGEFGPVDKTRLVEA